MMKYENKTIPIRELRENGGQIEGVPKNPRKIGKKDLEKLKKSLKTFPDMLKLRELVVYPYEGTFVVLGGNQRLRAAKENGEQEMPCKVLSIETPKEVLREFIIRDNQQVGADDWEILLTQWDENELRDWDVDMTKQPNGEKYSKKIQSVIYEPREVAPTIAELYNEGRYLQLVEKIKDVEDQELRKFLMLAAARFVVIDFEKCGDYYSSADKDTQRIFESLALVIPDIGAAIENGFINLITKIQKVQEVDYGVQE